jgi:replicative DNA helicase
LDVPVIALVQFNNEIWKRDKKVYLPSDFRNSGRIYQDADLIAAVHRPAAFDPDADPHEAEIVVFGSRQGPRGNVKCRWIPEITHFEDQS